MARDASALKGRPRGQSTLEMALVLCLVLCLCLATMYRFGHRIAGVFGCTAQAIDHPITGHCGPAGRL